MRHQGGLSPFGRGRGHLVLARGAPNRNCPTRLPRRGLRRRGHRQIEPDRRDRWEHRSSSPRRRPDPAEHVLTVNDRTPPARAQRERPSTPRTWRHGPGYAQTITNRPANAAPARPATAIGGSQTPWAPPLWPRPAQRTPATSEPAPTSGFSPWKEESHCCGGTLNPGRGLAHAHQRRRPRRRPLRPTRSRTGHAPYRPPSRRPRIRRPLRPHPSRLTTTRPGNPDNPDITSGAATHLLFSDQIRKWDEAATERPRGIRWWSSCPYAVSAEANRPGERVVVSGVDGEFDLLRCERGIHTDLLHTRHRRHLGGLHAEAVSYLGKGRHRRSR